LKRDGEHQECRSDSHEAEFTESRMHTT
jgi:hypothetical protein